ncbi:MAG: TonB-dependent receptor [Gammaproteobacteria bacterium]|nr:TonB-dependent receptor [Gammaproteobacteria bacterium]
MSNHILPARAGAVAVALFTVFVVFTVVAALFGSAAHAQAANENDDEPLTILITASKFAETADETLAPVTVITRAEIEEKQAATVEEVLRTVPGVALTNNGGVGKNTSLFLRGTASENVLVLIDGVKVGSATNGATPFQHLPIDQIEKIEVVRGPRSSLYGSEAIGGVIQIFTRKGGKDARPRMAVGGGSHDTVQGDFGVSGGSENAWYSISASAYSTEGFNACRGPGGCFTTEPDDDGYDNQSVSLRGGVTVSDALDLEGNFFNSDSETEFDGGRQNESETVTRVAAAKATLRLTEWWRSSLQIGESKDESDNFKDGVYSSTFNSTRAQVDWQNNFRLGDRVRVVAGVDYQDDRVDSSTNYTVDNRDNTGVFALLRTALNANDLEFSARNDDNEQFGNHATGSVAWGRDLGGGKRITASYGSAFRAPTFNELYYPGGGNPGLNPEKSKSLDFGVARVDRNMRLSANLFRTNVEDAIVGWPPSNIDKSEITGLELTAATMPGAWGDWDARANVTVQEPKHAGGGANDGNILIRRPKLLMNWSLTRRLGRHRLGAELHARSRAFIDAANTRATAGFATLNLRGEIALRKSWRLLLKINNALDKEYETVEYYPQDGRNFMATLRYTP